MLSYFKSFKRSKAIFMIMATVLLQSALPSLVYAAASLSFDTNSGKPGQNVTVTGEGWPAHASVGIFFGMVPSPTVAVDADENGNFTAKTQVPLDAPVGPLPVVAIDVSTSVRVDTVFNVIGDTPPPPTGNAYLTLDQFSGTPGKSLTVSGGGWTANDLIKIYLGSVGGSPVTSITTDAEGNFSTNITIPANSPQGPLAVIGVDSSNNQESNSYYVVPLTISLNVTAASHSPFSTIQISGSGFAPNENVTVSLAGASTTATADGSGAVSTSLTIPAVASGLYIVQAMGNSSGARSIDYENYFWIDAFYPSVAPSSYYIVPGQTLSFIGSGFAANETISVTTEGESSPLSTFTADQTGSFNKAGGFVAPAGYAGTNKTFTVTGSNSHVFASTGVTFGNFYPFVTPSSYWLMPSEKLSFNGGGFAANEIIDLTRASDGTKLGTITAGSDGTFENAGSITIPGDSANSSITVRLTGEVSHGQTEVTIGVGSFYPQISPSDYYVKGNTNITLTGSGFAANEKVILSVDGSSSTANVTTDNSGSFSAQVMIPFSSKSMVTLSALGEVSKSPASVDITLATFYPSIVPSTYYTYPGNKIRFSGAGFVPNETVTYQSDTGLTGTITTDAFGAFTTNEINVPFNLAAINFTFTGNLSNNPVITNIGIGTLYPIVTSDSYYAARGSTINLTASGFASGENINVAGGTFSASAPADVNGSATFPITIPYNTQGDSISFTATGAQSGASFTITIYVAPLGAQVTPDNYYATPGSNVIFSGSGFAPNEKVNISLNGSNVTSVTSDNSGNFTKSVTMPYGGKVAHLIFTGANSGSVYNLDVSLAEFYPYLVLSTYYAQSGSPLVITGNGFGPNENVSLSVNGLNFGTPKTDNNGAFVFTGTVPYAAPGAQNIQALGASSGALANSPITIAPTYTSFNLNTYAGAPGTSITLSGAGYVPGSQIGITTDRTGTTPITTATANSSGSWTTTYVIPSTFTEGNLILTATTGTNQNMDIKSIVFYVTGK